MNKTSSHLILLACSIFTNEISMLQQEGLILYPVEYIDSSYHMAPVKLQAELDKIITKNLNKELQMVLVLGECHARMDQTEIAEVKRTFGINCIEIILGKERYHQLRSEGAFFLMPEWTSRWENIFLQELGLTKENAEMIMNEMHTKLVYLDTGVQDIPWDTLDEIKHFTGLPMKVEKVNLEKFRHTIQQQVKEVTG